jgi:tRNA threonylcarbamoyladenosine biosynthesis protein TsaB
LITLAVDTSDARGSVALLRDGRSAATASHQDGSDYSAWLLPAVGEILQRTCETMKGVELLAVATGPGSFTGLRVGLTTVKAWAEVYGRPVVGVSRLEAMARSDRPPSERSFVAAFYDAQRGQIFAALYHSAFGRLARIEDELVTAPEEFLSYVQSQAGAQAVNWVALDPQLITSLPDWGKRTADTMQACFPPLAAEIGKLAEVRARSGEFSDPLALDANYVRRSDAEIFWKGR